MITWRKVKYNTHTQTGVTITGWQVFKFTYSAHLYTVGPKLGETEEAYPSVLLARGGVHPSQAASDAVRGNRKTLKKAIIYKLK